MSFLKKINVFIVMSTIFLYFSVYPLVLVVSESTSPVFSSFAKHKKSEQAYPTWLLLRNNDVNPASWDVIIVFCKIEREYFWTYHTTLKFHCHERVTVLKVAKAGRMGKVD